MKTRTITDKFFELFFTDSVYVKSMIKYFFMKKYIRNKILSSEETLALIEKRHCSIARFGDGEINIALELENSDIGFQKYDPLLAKELRNLLLKKDENLLLCLPIYLKSLRGLNRNGKLFWSNYNLAHQKEIALDLIADQRFVFGNTCITRPYMDFRNRRNAEKVFPMLKKLWEGRDIMIIEGRLTRMGVGNDLFASCRSIKRILAPEKNAFRCRNRIFETAAKLYKGELLLLALGPTATVLAGDFAKAGMQCLDIGHIDVEYEWFLQNAKQKIPLQGKYVNECVRNGSLTSCDNMDEYNKQIIAKVGF